MMLQTTRSRLLRATATTRRSVLLRCSAFSSASTDAAEVDAAAAARAARRASRVQPRAIEGTVPYYERHFVIVDAHGRAEDWPKKLEFSDHIVSSYAKVKHPMRLLLLISLEVANAIASSERSLNAIESKRGGDVKSSPLTITAAIPYRGAACQSQDSSGTRESEQKEAGAAHDVLVFPDNIRVHDVSESQILALVQEGVYNSDNLPAAIENLNLRQSPVDAGFHMLACAHANRSAATRLHFVTCSFGFNSGGDRIVCACRDFRCACAGPKMLQWLEEIALESNVPLHLWAASHYGGHRYAGNCVVYPSGDWFGMINSKEDVEQMVNALVDDQPLRLQDQWRGRIRMTKAEQIEALKQDVEDAA